MNMRPMGRYVYVGFAQVCVVFIITSKQTDNAD